MSETASESISPDTDTQGHPEPATDTAADDTAPALTDEPASETRGDREAAKYRRKLREEEQAHAAAKQDLDGAYARIAALQRQEVVRIAGQHLADGADVLNGRELSDFVDEDGAVSVDSIRSAVDNILASKPHYAKRFSASFPTSAVRGTDVGPVGAGNPKPSFSDAFAPKR